MKHGVTAILHDCPLREALEGIDSNRAVNVELEGLRIAADTLKTADSEMVS
ncbi:hypothetical protein TUM20985_20110 [Mycobacterium antarcticum]|uniref:hypothetical protein n=1 Tax=unclassified Mycolicibacterium TaxID=2636767 RepID=UPI0023943130|nr:MULTISPECIES: hypothetical protein [unclassified Mycolicibacterium]BDX31464.1 hypothetical protein TUM20985_20110 [Mycolicibacterium sp. TUM20985]GLP74811.1 hypothetical protein TUM20983_19210 [Mycolicibacterium sp. TUM20983]GLP80611.1 hypothetical protein TUM20984_20310 [Mycolicibacterium sp. TUM20984]